MNTNQRLLSGVELLLGAALVIGHNVFRVLPNEVLILAAVGLISVRLRDGSWCAMGIRRPGSWRTILLIALAAAAIRIIGGEYLLLPVLERFWPEPALPEDVENIAGNVKMALIYLGLVWGFAAFGEEIGYRGYLMQRAAQVLGGSERAWWIAVVVAAILFGLGHWYKGVSGVVDSGFAGLVFGAAYLLAGRNLYAPILAHGFVDTLGVAFLFFGWED